MAKKKADKKPGSYPVDQQKAKELALASEVAEIRLPYPESLEGFLDEVLEKLTKHGSKPIQYTGEEGKRESFMETLLGAQKYLMDLNSAVSKCRESSAAPKDISFDEDEKRALTTDPAFFMGTIDYIFQKTDIIDSQYSKPKVAIAEKDELLSEESDLVKAAKRNYPLFQKLFATQGKTGPEKS